MGHPTVIRVTVFCLCCFVRSPFRNVTVAVSLLDAIAGDRLWQDASIAVRPRSCTSLAFRCVPSVKKTWPLAESRHIVYRKIATQEYKTKTATNYNTE